MTNWLEKILPPALKGPSSRNLPANRRPGSLPVRPYGVPPPILPNASIVYGVAASALFVIALYFLLFTNSWVAGLLVLMPAACFLGFSLHFLKHPHS